MLIFDGDDNAAGQAAAVALAAGAAEVAVAAMQQLPDVQAVQEHGVGRTHACICVSCKGEDAKCYSGVSNKRWWSCSGH